MNKLNTVFSAMALSVLAMSASAADYDKMHKQLSIMENIIKSATSDLSGSHKKALRNIESTYLAGQGAVFTVSLNNGNGWQSGFNFSFADVPMPPTPPITAIAPGVSIEQSEELREEIEEAMEDASRGYEEAMSVLKREREEYRDLRDETRDLDYEVRDVDREKRDIEYQLKRANEKAKKELLTELKALKSREKELVKHKEILAKKSAKITKKQKQKKEELAQKRVKSIKQVTNTVIDTLCMYGNGLKAVPKKENVTLVVKSAGSNKGRSYKDKIYVFNKKDVLSCSSESIDVKKLTAKAKIYEF